MVRYWDILEEEVTRFADRLDIRCKRKNLYGPKGFSLSNCKNGFSIYRMRKELV